MTTGALGCDSAGVAAGAVPPGVAAGDGVIGLVGVAPGGGDVGPPCSRTVNTSDVSWIIGAGYSAMGSVVQTRRFAGRESKVERGSHKNKPTSSPTSESPQWAFESNAEQDAADFAEEVCQYEVDRDDGEE